MQMEVQEVTNDSKQLFEQKVLLQSVGLAKPLIKVLVS
jgi:hypothetical protein